MVDRIHLGRDDRKTIEDIIQYGLKHHEQWVGGRLALARSLQMSGRTRSAGIPKTVAAARWGSIARNPVDRGR